MSRSIILGVAAAAAMVVAVWAARGTSSGASHRIELVNASYDPTRELWRDLNSKFIRLYQEETGSRLTIKQSHGGSSSQARAVIDGLDADVVTLALWSDIDAIRQKGLIKPGWEERLS